MGDSLGMALDTGEAGSATLLVHDGELGDVRDLLCTIGTPFVECRGIGAPRDPGFGWDLILASPKRMLEIDDRSDRGRKLVKIAVSQSYSRTLNAAMFRSRVDFLVRRPVHPEALRLLILHALYRGPERRRAARVSVGAPIHFRSGYSLQPAVLLDLSTTGCRITSEHPARTGFVLTLVIPVGRDETETLLVRGRVANAYPTHGAAEGVSTLHIKFERLSASDRKRLAGAVASFSEGPARLPTELAPMREAAADAPEEPVDRDADEEESESRGDPRRIFDRRVIVLTEDATRVMVGCDLSAGGMRARPDPNLSVADELTIALPLPARKVPLVVRARVIRDDGEDGLVLRFLELSQDAEECLRESLGLLPICDSPFEDEEPAWVIVSEVIDRAR